MLLSVLPRLAKDSAARLFPGVWKPLFLRFSSREGSPIPRAPSLPPLSLFSSFIFFPTCFWRQWSALLGAWCPLPAFRSCFVEFTQRGNGLLMNLWGRKWSPHPIPPPSSLCLLKCFRWGRTRSNHKQKSCITNSQVSVRICGRNFYRGYWMFIFNRVRI